MIMCEDCNVEMEYDETYDEWVCPICGLVGHEEDDDETLDVYRASEIWASYGKDEDYMFGYTEEELEAALRD